MVLFIEGATCRIQPLVCIDSYKYTTPIFYISNNSGNIARYTQINKDIYNVYMLCKY